MLKIKTKYESGFSLIELMIVVAIIGMLVAVGIPQYAKFQAKARQSEAKAALTNVFTAQKSFRVEWQYFTYDLKNTGFSMAGKNLRYIVGFGGVTATTVPCALGSNYSGPPEILAGTTNSWSNGTSVNDGGVATWHNQINFLNIATADPDDPTMLVVAPAGCTQDNFTALAIGDVRNNPGDIDVASNSIPTNSDIWLINDQKSLQQVRQGF